jgi:hypothetical protein
LVHIATSINYNRDLEKEKKNLEREKKKNKWQEALITVLKEAPLGQSPNPRTCFQCRKVGHFRRVSTEEVISRTLSHLSWKSLEDTLSSVPRGTNARASHQCWVPGSPIQALVITIKTEKLWAIFALEKYKVSLLIDTRDSISSISFSPGPRSSKKITVWAYQASP